MQKVNKMESVIRNVVEPYFENILIKISNLDKKINTMDMRMEKLETELQSIGCKFSNASFEYKK